MVYFQYSIYYKYAQRTKGNHAYRVKEDMITVPYQIENINKKTENSAKSIATEMMNSVE